MTTRDEEGVTLVELVVAMMLLSMLSLMLFTFVNGLTTFTTRADRHVHAEQEAQLALRKVTEEIRAASPIVDDAGCAAGFQDCLRFDLPRVVNFTHDCERRRISYRLDRSTGRLLRDSADWVWDSSVSACVQTNAVVGKVMMKSLDFPAATDLFIYTDQAGTTITDPAVIPDPPSVGGTAAVKVNLIVEYQKDAPDLVLASNAVLRNNR